MRCRFVWYCSVGNFRRKKSKMIIPCIRIKRGKVVDYSSKEVDEVQSVVERLRVCPNVSLQCCDSDEKTKESLKEIFQVFSCSIHCEAQSLEDALELLNNACQMVVVNQNMEEVISCFPEDLKNRITISIDDHSHEKESISVVAATINKVKEQSFYRALVTVPKTARKPGELKNYGEELIRLVGTEVKIVLSLQQGDASLSEIEDLHALDIDIQIDASFIGNGIDLGDVIGCCARSDRRDGLFQTVVTDEHGVAVGLVFSSKESIREAVRIRKGVYHSRRRGLWRKGETSGNTQELLKIYLDCDSDALRFVVRQQGQGFCHQDTWSCFGPTGGVPALMRTLEQRKATAPPGSYTDRLYKDDQLLNAKLLEEAEELCEAQSKEEVAWEAADVLYFALVKCAKAGVSLADVEAVLDQRALKVKRRPGNAKPNKIAAGDCEQQNGEAPVNGKSTKLPSGPNHLDTKSSLKAPGSELKCYSFNNLDTTQLQSLCRRPAILDSPKILSLVKPIIEMVQKSGDKALIELTEKFDKAKLSSPVLEVAAVGEPALESEVQQAIDVSYGNIYRFHKAQLQQEPLVVETCPGVVCSRHVRPIEKVGLYVPGGTAVLPSTALMLGIPAQVAGCGEIVLATPPKADGTVSPEILYIAKKIGASKILLAGGAQAIAAMAYGTESVPKVDKICGPGNQFVTTAKMLVQNDSSAFVSIDMPAGPSEIMVIADGSANPSFVASDLLSQAEHGPDSQVVLISVDLTPAQLQAIQEELEQQVKKLPRENIARAALSKSFALTVPSMAEALQFSNMYAPEHLIINAKDADGYMKRVQNAGSVFMGPYSCESCGDYTSGTNHTLPTYGYARMYSGVSTSTYQKHVTCQNVSQEGLGNIGPAVAVLAAVEKLDAHRNAVLVRQQQIQADTTM